MEALGEAVPAGAAGREPARLPLPDECTAAHLRMEDVARVTHRAGSPRPGGRRVMSCTASR
ncbi:hypothetical protein I5Q34_17595 [Streptomyces sp. AV19]|uniref:hypothetical protein n=1 Tax=Streptomyces sp. AV19 TaxID=2793068 RepID=UPI0018FF000E|nr:hypothetical protein [Streptomyces sp. AV19]MBH1936061.1 hypothetical protein [Streptomyces sp. AV19]MDG4534145.1 hypothetical protein [Streptomyces sp. AV19]